MRAILTTALELVGIGLIVGGCAAFSPILGVISAGFALIVIGVTQA